MSTASSAPQQTGAAGVKTEEERQRIMEVSKIALRRVDAILEPDCFLHLKKFIANGGKPQDVIQFLASGYRGYAEMCNLLCTWLRSTGMSREEIVSIVENYFKKTIKENFDQKLADSIVTASEPPAWLELMLQTESWRQLFYDLSEQHPDCLLLNFAIQSVARSGHLSEIAPLAATANFFTLYNQVLCETFCNLVDVDEHHLVDVIAQIKRMCNHTEASYLYSQALLHALAAEPNGIGFKRISEELEAEMRHICAPAQRAAWHLTHIAEHELLHSALQSMLSSGQTNEADIGKLYSVYTSPSPPPVAYIRRPDLLELLIRDMFTSTSSSWDAQYRRQHFFLVAYAVSMHDDRPITSFNQSEQPIEPPPGGLSPEVDRTLSAIIAVNQKCTRILFGIELAAAVEEIREYLPIQVVSAGLLYWVRANIAEREHFATTYNTKSLPVYLSLLKEICYLHPFLRPKVVDVLVASFETESDLEAIILLEARKLLLDAIVYIVECGYCIPVLDVVCKWSERVDYSLTRHFVVKLLDMCGPPYSIDFVSRVIRIIDQLPAESIRMGGGQTLIVSLLDHVLSNNYPLDPTLLSRIKAKRSLIV